MANQAEFPVRVQCRVLDVSASGYYAWLRRPPSVRSLHNAVLSERIRAIHAESDATYGMPKVRAELMAQGETISRKRVAKLMRHRRGCVG
jgi:putative transposase